MIATRRIYLTRDQSAAVEEGDPRAAFLLVAKGCEIDVATANRYGLDFSAKPKAPPATPPKPSPAKQPPSATKPK